MVKIIGISDEERESRKRLEWIAEKAREIFPERYRVEVVLDRSVVVSRESDYHSVRISPDFKKILINEPSVLEQAVSLAGIIEQRYKEEYTVKKEYE